MGLFATAFGQQPQEQGDRWQAEVHRQVKLDVVGVDQAGHLLKAASSQPEWMLERQFLGDAEDVRALSQHRARVPVKSFD